MTLEQQRKEMEQKFATIKWNHHPCGRGSVFEHTKQTRDLLSKIVKQYNIKTVSDAGAGDLSWVHAVNWNVEYKAYDIRQWHPDVIKFDITKDVLPKTDLIMCRHVINHLQGDLIEEALKRFEESGSRYIFMTTKGKQLTKMIERWGDPLETSKETFPGGRTWIYALWQINNE